MEQVAIGKSGLKTSRIGLGTWAIGGSMWGGTDEAQAIATIRSALERGVTLIDTTPVYGFGHSEEVVGKALAEGGLRDKAQIATKFGLAWKDSEIYRDSRRARVRKEIEDSLRRLRTDVIDIYQVHWPDLDAPIEETARGLVNTSLPSASSTPLPTSASASRCWRSPSVGSSTRVRPTLRFGVRAGPANSIRSAKSKAGRSMSEARLTSMRSWLAA